MFCFTLPDERIARYPAQRRSDSALLQVHIGKPGQLADHGFAELPGLLHHGDLLVINDSRVLPARLRMHKPTGGKVELLFERELAPTTALALLKSSRPLHQGAWLEHASGDFRVMVGQRVHGAMREAELHHRQGCSWPELVRRYGEMPLPPYLNRSAEAADNERYQTVYAREDGSVAAPTAGLHFDEPLLNTLRKRGITIATVTLHVGYGTFATPDPDATSLHAERYQLPAQTAAAIAATKARGKRVIAVGTTSARVLESVALAGTLQPCSGETTLCIKPGFRFQVIDGLITNFHLPGTSLLWLVAALAGEDTIQAAYNHALAGNYRFFSYGDAMLICRA